MKNKNDLIEELFHSGYTHEFVYKNLTVINKRKIIEFLFKEKQNKPLFHIQKNTFENAATLIFDSNQNIVAMSLLSEVFYEDLKLTFYEFSYYVGKNHRLKGIKPSILHKILYPLTYYESHKHTINNQNNKISGLFSHTGNQKISSKYLLNKKLFVDDYWYALCTKFSSQGNHYVWYYPNDIS